MCLWEFHMCESVLPVCDAFWLNGFAEQLQVPYSSSLVKILKPQFLIHFIAKEAFKSPVNSNATLYCTEPVLFENDVLDSWL